MDRVGEYTLQIMREAGWYNSWLFSFIEPHLGKDTLEVGSGIGNFTELLLEKTKLVAVDLNKEYISNLKKRYKKRLSVGFGNIEKGEYYFKNKKFDTVVCFNVLEHVQNDEKALKNMFSLLQKGGKLLLLVPARELLFSEFDQKLGHWRRYSKFQIDKLVRKIGFKSISVRYLNWWSAIGWLIFLKFTKRNKMPQKEVKIFDFLGKIFLWPEKYAKMPFGLSVLAVAQK